VTKETIGSLGSLGSLPPAPSAQPPVVTDSDAAEARGAKIFTEAVLTCLGICALFADEHRLMGEDANLARIRKESAADETYHKSDHDFALNAIVHSAQSRCARDIANEIRRAFGISSED
jgi:hypothetical protein